MDHARKRPFAARVVLVAAALLVGAGGTLAEAAAPKPTKLTLAAATKVLAVGQTYKAKIQAATPAKASKAVTWTSSNRKVATVTAAGKIKALKTGKATIKATSKVSRKVTAKLALTVSLKPTGITVTPTTETLSVGQTFTAKVATITPAKASKQVSWTSSNTSVATVTGKGVVQAVAAGSTTITATSVLNSKVKQTIAVTVSGTGSTPGPGSTPEQPAPVIDPKLLGSWSLLITGAGSTHIFNADGTWEGIVILAAPFSPHQQYSKGNYRAEGGKIYYSDIVRQSRKDDSEPWSAWTPSATPNRIENYAVGTDEDGEYLVREDDPDPITAESVKYRRGT